MAMLHIRWRALATTLLTAGQFAGIASAQTPRFDFPADCTVGADCWYRAYVDLASDSTYYRDHRCGARSYENHRGTDIAPYSTGDPPFRVPAAAVGLRDGLDDTRPLRDDSSASSRQGVECGNGVGIDHGGGWVTHYSHLRRGSVTVSRDARVEARDVLGVIGSSGRSDTPYLHFQVERDATPLDSFTATLAARPVRCDAAGSMAGSLWRSPAQQGLVAYEPVVIYRAGSATGRPDSVRAGYEGYPTETTVSAKALGGYVVLLGGIGGTTVDTVITGPNGAVVFENSAAVPRDFAR